MQDSHLIVRFSSLGDIVLTSPTVLNLRLNAPHGRLAVLTKEKYGPIARMMDGVDEVVCIPDHASLPAYIKSLMKLDRDQVTTLVDLHANARSWLAGKMVASDRAVRRPKKSVERRLMVKRRNKVLPAHYSHTVDLNNDVLGPLDYACYADRPVLYPDPANGIEGVEQDCIIISPGAAHETKAWPITRFMEVATALRTDSGSQIVWLYETRSEIGRRLDQALAETSDCRLKDLSLEAAAATMQTASVCLSNDSGIGHLASAVGTPVVALFGPTHPALGFAPKGLDDELIQVNEWCRPCSLHGKKPCFRDEQYCFSRIDSAVVVEKILTRHERRRRRRPALLLDRDGTVIREKGFLSDPEGVELEDGAVEAIMMAQERGYAVALISNQSGVARGYFSVDSVERINARTLELLAARNVEVDGVYFCPYHPEGTVTEFAQTSRHRKPSPGMAEQAATELNLDLRRSLMIGDRKSDLDLGRVIGARTALVRTGYGAKALRSLPPESRERSTVAGNVLDAVRTLLGGNAR